MKLLWFLLYITFVGMIWKQVQYVLGYLGYIFYVICNIFWRFVQFIKRKYVVYVGFVFQDTNSLMYNTYFVCNFYSWKTPMFLNRIKLYLYNILLKSLKYIFWKIHWLLNFTLKGNKLVIKYCTCIQIIYKKHMEIKMKTFIYI